MLKSDSFIDNDVKNVRKRLEKIDPVEIERGLKWLISFRVVFSIVLIFSTLIFSTNEDLPLDSQPFLSVYILSLIILFLSVLYGWSFRTFCRNPLFVYLQLTLDVFSVTAIIYITGSFNSIFTFLYLVVIIGSSMLLFRKGSMIMATLCSLQYGILIDLEYYQILEPIVKQVPLSTQVAWTHIIYRIVIIMTACFAVALLSGFLALQARKARKELKVMADHVKRVEKMATMGEIAAGMAHEIKNPLASLSGAIQMLKEEAPPGTHNYRLMQIVLRETERLSRIVTDFLLFARPCASDFKNVLIAPEIRDTVKIFMQDSLFAGRIHFEMDLDDEVSIGIDTDHLRQILWNLLKNAAESIEGDGTIEIDLIKTRSDRIFLRISDTGSGIPSDILDSVFNPFFTTKSNGTGLGLSIVHRMIDFYNGIIDVDSDLNYGTTVTIIFKYNAEKTVDHQSCVDNKIFDTQV
ncbi:putative pilS, sensory histidne kinase [Desulfamplus magnetovallimortis]|uniref:histidine kinase n=1 Tax=Desulfamplus magnetovallimortis TaxID=1246637 RepID=A0A1W1H506_9BACT|nr:ATP-binding protein [Desulfamplus magnetovallimortis]SLM27448.1 putative pilS, sensory histidne kinase [Desulfamplus magnetovallimortis]